MKRHTTGSASELSSFGAILRRRASAHPGRPLYSFLAGDEGQRASLTYGELDRRANQLAHRLRAMSAGPESIIALSLEPSFEMVIALLAVLKAGGAYLPLDPKLPWPRMIAGPETELTCEF